MKILTVDDSLMIRTLVRKYLGTLEVEVVEASNGTQGLEMIRNENPDLVILDVNMPEMNGSEMLRKVREDITIKDVPVLMLSAESGQKLVLELIQLGISDYIVKPFQEALLKKKVCKILGIDPVNSRVNESEVTGRKILVLDDNESILLVARKFLSGIAEVITTTRPEKALQLAGQYLPQVVLLNLQTDGLKTLKTLKADYSFHSSKFVAILTTSTSDQASVAKDAGFSDVLLKPFNRETLTQIVS